MSYRNITILAAPENGGPGLKVAQTAIEPCPDASTGWGIMTPGDPDVDAELPAPTLESLHLTIDGCRTPDQAREYLDAEGL